MIIWMLWSLLFAGLVGIGAMAMERVAALLGVPRRYVWMVALAVGAGFPVALALGRSRQAIALSPPGATHADQPSLPAESAQSIPSPRPTPSTRSTEVTPSIRTAEIPAARLVQSPIPWRLQPELDRAELEAATADDWVAGLWAFSSLVVLLVFARTMGALGRRSAAWRETDVGPGRALISPHEGPAVIGFARPRIVLPEWALSLDQRARDLMLRHELEHIRMGDPRAVFVAGIVLIVLPWNAGLWWIARRLRFAMELDCDARVVRALGARREYALMLVAVAERYLVPLPLAASLADPMLLERRIDAITTRRSRRPLLAAVPFAAVAGLVIVAASKAPRPEPLSPLTMHRTATVVKDDARAHSATEALTPSLSSASASASAQAHVPGAGTDPAPMPPRGARASNVVQVAQGPGFQQSAIMRRLLFIALNAAYQARHDRLPLTEAAIVAYRNAIAETIRDTTQAPLRASLDQMLGTFTLDAAKATKDTAAKRRYLDAAKLAFLSALKDPQTRWDETAANGLAQVTVQSGDTATMMTGYFGTLSDPHASYLDLIKAAFAADIAAKAGIEEARRAELQLFRKAAAVSQTNVGTIFTMSIAIAGDSQSATRPLSDRLMIVDPSTVTKHQAVLGVYAMLQRSAAALEDHYTALADAATKQSDSVASGVYADSARAWDDSSRVFDREFNEYLAANDSALVGVEVANWRPRNDGVEVAGTMTNWTAAARGGTIHVEFLNEAAQTVSTADIPFALDPKAKKDFTVTGLGSGIVASRYALRNHP